MIFDIAVFRRMPQHRTEATRIAESQYLGADLHVEMIVLLRGHVLRQDANVTGHAKVNDQRAMIEMDQQIFAAPSGAAHRAAGQRLCQLQWKRPAQPGMAKFHAADDLSFQMRCNAATRDFDFR